MTNRRDRLFVNASALMISSVATGALGLVYWIVAGRFFAASDVGHASALISTATMLSSIACLSLGGSYQRFLPAAGRSSARLIVAGYLLTGVVALALGTVFGLSPLSDKLLDGAAQRMGFAVMVLVFAYFALTDSVLTGLGRAPAVAVKNVSASVVKIVPLFLLSGAVATAGIVTSWTGISLVLVAVFVVVALRAAVERRETSQLPSAGELLRYQSAFLAMMLVAAALPLALPLIVVNKLGTAENAYFNLAWTMCTATLLLRAAMGSAFIVEASTPGADRRALLRRILPVYAMVTGATAAGLAVGGPLVLLLAGREYFDAGWRLMVIMAVVTLLEALVGGYYLIAQLLRHLRLMTLVQCLTVVITVGGSYLFVPRLGITAIGLAEGAAMVAALAVAGRPLIRGLRTLRNEARYAGASAAPGSGDGLDQLATAEADGLDTRVAHHGA